MRHRRQLKSLDNVQALTRGAPLSWTNLLSSIRPMDHVFTGVFQPGDDSEKLIGQVGQSPNMTSAHLNYLLKPTASNPDDLVPLLEGLIEQAAHWGAKQVVADLLIGSDFFTQFRQSGFSVLAKQRVFRCHQPVKNPDQFKEGWQIWTRDDINAMRRLYVTLVPPLIQPIEPLSRREMLGLVYYDKSGALQAYADLVYGPVGAWVLPLIHPQIDVNISDLLAQMLLNLPNLYGRSVFVTVRSYQPWVEHALENLTAEPGPEQVWMVRHLTLRQRVESEFSFASIENGKPEPTIPLAPIKNHQE